MKDYSSSEWTPERGYLSENSSYPFRAKRLSSVAYHLKLKNADAENCCGIKMFKIIPHLPSDIPTQLHYNRFYLKYGEYFGIEFEAKSIRTDDTLRTISPDQRNCYFEGEKMLKFFKSYSRAHCNLECMANITLKKCGCVKFYMPRDKNTKICTFTQLECRWNSSHKLTSFYTEDEMMACDCYSPCNDIKYSYNVFRTDNFVTSIDK